MAPPVFKQVKCIHTAINYGPARACPLCRSERAVAKLMEHHNTIDASDMTRTCSKCAGGTPASPAVTCEGKRCLLKKRAEVYAFDVRDPVHLLPVRKRDGRDGGGSACVHMRAV